MTDETHLLLDSERRAHALHELMTIELTSALSIVNRSLDDGSIVALNERVLDALARAYQKGQQSHRVIDEFLCSVDVSAEYGRYYALTLTSLSTNQDNSAKRPLLRAQWDAHEDHTVNKLMRTLVPGSNVIVTIRTLAPHVHSKL